MRNRAWWQLVMAIAVGLLVATVGTALAEIGGPPEVERVAPAGAGAKAAIDSPVGVYGFSIVSGSYADLTGDTPFTVNGGGGTLDDGYSADQTIPFTFVLGASGYTTYRVNTNGWLAFGSPTATTNYSALSGTVNDVIAFCNRDLNNTGAVYSSVTEGSAPNRIHKIQAKNFYRYNTSTMTGNAQVWLYESTNVVEIHYGAFDQTWTSGSTVQVGLRGASTGTGDVASLAGTGATTWSAPTFGNLSTSTMSLALTVTPTSGLTYVFAPFVGVTVSPATQLGSVCPGNDVPYTVAVTNATGSSQAFNLTYTSVWPATGPAATGVIADGGAENVSVTVHVPGASATGSSDLLTVTATAATTGTYTGSATATTTAALASGWLDLANVTDARGVRFHSVVYAGGKLYKIGGYNGTAAQAWLDIYDVAGNTWTAGADMPAALYYIDCEAISGKIYCAGGYTGSAGTDTLYIYDIAGNSWSTGATLPAARYNYASAQVGGKYYVLGGYTTGYEATILVYDPVANTWDATRASMSIARRGAQAGVIGGKIYVVGGRDTASTFPASGEAYDPVANTWSPIAPMPAGWINAADGVVHDRYLILTGGYGGDLTASNYGLMYDAVNNAWSFLPTVNHQVYGWEADSDGTSYWMVSGRIYEGGAFSYSLYTTIMTECPVVPVELQTFTIE
jgi:hypothetical protein